MDIIRRNIPFELRDASGDGLTIAGYATTFDQPYEVWDWDGRYNEQFVRGAFRDTIGSGQKPKMQFNHGNDLAFGSLPIGTWTRIREDKRGLWMEGRINDNWHTEPIRQAIGDGQIEGMSIAFSVVVEEWDDSGDIPLRSITAADLFEAGPVVWPANSNTSVSVRAREFLAGLNDPEIRAELARILTMPTPRPETTGEGGEDSRDDVTLDAGSDERSTPNPNDEVLLLLRRHTLRRDTAA